MKMIEIKQTGIEEFSILSSGQAVAKASFRIEGTVLKIGEIEVLAEDKSMDMADALHRTITNHALSKKIEQVEFTTGEIRSPDEVLVHKCKV